MLLDREGDIVTKTDKLEEEEWEGKALSLAFFLLSAPPWDEPCVVYVCTHVHAGSVCCMVFSKEKKCSLQLQDCCSQGLLHPVRRGGNDIGVISHST